MEDENPPFFFGFPSSWCCERAVAARTEGSCCRTEIGNSCLAICSMGSKGLNFITTQNSCTWSCLATRQYPRLCLQHHCFHPSGPGEGDEKEEGHVVLKDQKNFSGFCLKDKGKENLRGK